MNIFARARNRASSASVVDDALPAGNDDFGSPAPGSGMPAARDYGVGEPEVPAPALSGVRYAGKVDPAPEAQAAPATALRAYQRLAVEHGKLPETVLDEQSAPATASNPLSGFLDEAEDAASPAKPAPASASTFDAFIEDAPTSESPMRGTSVGGAALTGFLDEAEDAVSPARPAPVSASTFDAFIEDAPTSETPMRGTSVGGAALTGFLDEAEGDSDAAVDPETIDEVIVMSAADNERPAAPTTPDTFANSADVTSFAPPSDSAQPRHVTADVVVQFSPKPSPASLSTIRTKESDTMAPFQSTAVRPIDTVMNNANTITIAKGLKIKGGVETDTDVDLVVGGIIEASQVVARRLTILPGASVSGEHIHAEEMVVQGTLKGQVECKKFVAEAGSTIDANITARAVVVDERSDFEGTITISRRTA